VSAISTDSYLPYSPRKVWNALTNSDLLARWLMPNDFVAKVGYRFTFKTDPVPQHGFDGVIHCEVLTLLPELELSISWHGGSLDSTVTWRLEPEGAGTRLLLTHDGFDESDPGQLMTKQILGGGWNGKIAARLAQLLEAEEER
jgi:uncharacterized protein YndB with AHSA1/START domain